MTFPRVIGTVFEATKRSLRVCFKFSGRLPPGRTLDLKGKGVSCAKFPVPIIVFLGISPTLTFTLLLAGCGGGPTQARGKAPQITANDKPPEPPPKPKPASDEQPPELRATTPVPSIPEGDDLPSPQAPATAPGTDVSSANQRKPLPSVQQTPPAAETQQLRPANVTTAIARASQQAEQLLDAAPASLEIFITGSQTSTLMETERSQAKMLGPQIHVAGRNKDDAAIVSVSDSRFEVRNEGKLWVKAGQRFDFECEPVVSLIITATESGGTGLNDRYDLIIGISNDLNESPFTDAYVPIDQVPVFLGQKLAAYTITTKWRGANHNIGLERIGHWDVYNQDGGNILTLKLRFGDGVEQLVARLIRHDAQSPYQFDESAGLPAIGENFGGDYGMFQITGLHQIPADGGDSRVRVKWKYVIFSEEGSGAPVNRLAKGVSASEWVNLIVESGAVGETGAVRRNANAVNFTLLGKDDRPLFLEAVDVAQSPGEAFPVADPEPDSPFNWRWWQEDIIRVLEWRPKAKKITVDREDGLVWRFVPVDVDGDFFQPAADSTQMRDYGDITNFVEQFIQYRMGSKRRQSHPIFEVVQAEEASGAPLFISMPDDEDDRLPALDLRLRPDVTDQKIAGQRFTLVLKGADTSFPNNFVTQEFHVDPIPAEII